MGLLLGRANPELRLKLKVMRLGQVAAFLYFYKIVGKKGGPLRPPFFLLSTFAWIYPTYVAVFSSVDYV